MSIEITAREDLSAEKWDRLIEQSSAGTPFHYNGVIETVAEYADATLHPLVGYKGQEPVGVFPLFEKTKGPVTVVLSPPPDLQIPSLGPSPVNRQELNVRKRDIRNDRFVRAVSEWIEEQIGPHFTNVQTSARYGDIRPFIWEGYDAVPRFTYQVELPSDPDELLERFSRSVRTSIRDEYDCEWTISHGEPRDIDRILTQVRKRYEDQGQGEVFSLTASFLHDLRDRLPEGTLRWYVCRIDGSFDGGIITLETDSTICGWLGGAKTGSDLPVNDLLYWDLCRGAIDRDLEHYDLVGANHERIYKYKAKFAPELHTYYNLQKGSTAMNVGVEIYRHLRDRGLFFE